MSVSEQLRKAINAALQTDTLYRIAKETDINWSAIQRFMKGTELRSGTIDKLADYLGLELRPKKQRAKKGKRADKQSPKK